MRFRERELEYMRSLRFIKSDFVDFLAIFQMNPKYITVTPSTQKPGEIEIVVRGPWLHTIMFETTPEDFETAILFTGDANMADINGQWRGKPQATNVLSFPAAENLNMPLGEVLAFRRYCAGTGRGNQGSGGTGEAVEGSRQPPYYPRPPPPSGLDHEDEAEADEMEQLERHILKGFGFPDPYYERP